MFFGGCPITEVQECNESDNEIQAKAFMGINEGNLGFYRS